MRNAISVDVEDYFQTEAMSPAAPSEYWDTLPSRVQRNTERLFEIFDRHHTRATFFFLGWVAQKFPLLVNAAVIQRRTGAPAASSPPLITCELAIAAGHCRSGHIVPLPSGMESPPPKN